MKMDDAIEEFGSVCKVRNLSDKKAASVHIKQFLSMKDNQGCKARYAVALALTVFMFPYRETVVNGLFSNNIQPASMPFFSP